MAIFGWSTLAPAKRPCRYRPPAGIPARGDALPPEISRHLSLHGAEGDRETKAFWIVVPVNFVAQFSGLQEGLLVEIFRVG